MAWVKFAIAGDALYNWSHRSFQPPPTIMEVYLAVPTSYSLNISRFPTNNRDDAEKPQAGEPRSAPGRDQVVLSPAGQKLARAHGTAAALATTDSGSLDRQEMLELRKLTERDAEVRIHEQAHLSAAGQFARGGASFTYQRGPDGVSYAIGGEVGIDVGKEATPEATITKMRIVKRAALAPAAPSAADRSIAAQAAVKESQARQEVLSRLQEDLLDIPSRTQDVDVNEHPAAVGEEVRQEPPASSHGSLQAGIATYQRVAGNRQP